MPVFSILGWTFFFWSNEFIGNKLEPIHIHVCKGKPSKNAPKWWVGYGRKTSLASFDNAERYGIKQSDKAEIEEIIKNNANLIIELWHEHFVGHDLEVHDSVK
ncbi:MAG: DUF4160 domain-containing protein [Oscillospiraceae bacterium]|nr:DUF4160 domain-containing protein [Oscillospiraceae bacterium]